MPKINVQLPAGVGERVLVRADDLAGHVALLISWRLTRPRFTVGGALDGQPQLALQVLTEQGEERWIRTADVAGAGEPVLMSIALPFAGGDAVVVHPARVPGEIRGWEITGRRLETSLTYLVHLNGTPPGDTVEVDARNLEHRTRAPASETA